MYHRVTPRIAGVPRPTWNVTPERFRRQLQCLLSRGYQAWPLRRAVACRQAGEPIPPHMFVVTFDDGYECVYEEAWPILKELAVPATVFAVTSCLDADGPLSSDDWTAAGSAKVRASAWRPLRTAQCAEMIEHGLVEVGSHTHTHVDWRGQPEAFRRDLACSLKVLRDVFGVEQASFTFPYGYHDPELIAVAREAGALCVLTAEERLISPQVDPFAWGRLKVVESDTAATLAFKLSGWYTGLRSALKWLKGPWHACQAVFGLGRTGPKTRAARLSPPKSVDFP